MVQATHEDYNRSQSPLPINHILHLIGGILLKEIMSKTITSRCLLKILDELLTLLVNPVIRTLIRWYIEL